MINKKCFGISGWKNAGKTTLVAGLVKELTNRGLIVSTVKHAHHGFDLDQPDTDSHQHRSSGAREVAIVSSMRWAIMHELTHEDEPALDDILLRLSPCDLVLIEGYKGEPIPKIEIIGPGTPDEDQRWRQDANIVGVATDEALDGCKLPVFPRGDVSKIADFIHAHVNTEVVDA